jgi:hypothetical protein
MLKLTPKQLENRRIIAEWVGQIQRSHDKPVKEAMILAIRMLDTLAESRLARASIWPQPPGFTDQPPNSTP